MQCKLSFNAKFALVFSLVALLLASTPTALAQEYSNRYWTAVASTGVLDEADTGKLVFNGGTASFPEILPPLPTNPLEPAKAAADSSPTIVLPTTTTTATLRYNVVAVDGLFSPTRAINMLLRYRDNGASAQVYARLVEYNINTGVETTRLTFDSNNYAQSANYQVASTGIYQPNWGFDFVQKAYYVEVTLTKTSSSITPLGGGRPGLAIVQINTIAPIL